MSFSDCNPNPKIRVIDGASFYTLVTGENNALKDFYTILPLVIEEIFKSEFRQDKFKIADKIAFTELCKGYSLFLWITFVLFGVVSRNRRNFLQLL